MSDTAWNDLSVFSLRDVTWALCVGASGVLYASNHV